MHRKIAHLIGIALLFAGSAGADDLGLSGPTATFVGMAYQYKLTFKLGGPVAARSPKASIRNPAGMWTESTATATTTNHGDGTRTVNVTKMVLFNATGAWHIKLSAQLWTTPPCRKSPCPGPYQSGSRFGTTNVTAMPMPI